MRPSLAWPPLDMRGPGAGGGRKGCAHTACSEPPPASHVGLGAPLEAAASPRTGLLVPSSSAGSPQA